MSTADVAMKPIVVAAAAVAGSVVFALAAAFALLHVWHLAPGGTPLHGAEGSVAMAATFPALQSAPQLDRERAQQAQARTAAASQVRR